MTSKSSDIKIALLTGDRLCEEQTHKAAGSLRGAFESHGLKCGIYTLKARIGREPQTAQRQIILATNPWGK